jgi:Cu2+-exporting ATPase
VVAGSLNLVAPVTMRVERVGADTRYAAIVALVRDAMSQRPALAASADRWAAPFLWAVLLLAASGAAVWSVLDPARAVWVAVSVLIVTCPCALSLAAPSALLAATGRMARRGVLLQRLDAIEAMARVRRVFVDKTGTLTLDRPQWRPRGGDAEQRWFGTAASLAAWSGHPLAQALAEAAGVAPASAGTSWQAVREQPGHGLSALDGQGVEWRLGFAAWVGAVAEAQNDRAEDAAHGQDDERKDTEGAPRVWLGRAGRPLAFFSFDERLRDDALAAVRALHALGVRVELLSGDAPARAQRMAQRLGLDAARGGASPQQKLDAVRAAQAAGDRVAMVGDGVNDAPVLAQADASFALGQGALAARASADAIVLSMRLTDVADALGLARRTLHVVHQNLGWAAAYNATCVPLALLGWLPPWAAGLGMAGSSLVVVRNALRLAR